MNKIFRIVWNQATQAWVAVSELTKAHKKQSSSNTLKAVVGSMVMMLGVNSVDAAVAIGSTSGNTISAGTAKNTSGGVSIGNNADTSQGANNVAIGENARVGSVGSVGSDIKVRTNPAGQSIAIGGGTKPDEGARAFGNQSIAIGGNTLAEGNSSIAIGNDDVESAISQQTTYTNTSGKQVTDTVGKAYKDLTGKDINAEGTYRDTKAGQAAIAIGVKAQAGNLSLALGTASTANQVNAVAIGSGATATRDNAVAIGGGSTTEAAGTKEVNSTINDITYTWEGGQNTVAGDVVSFGRAGFERQLKHVAAGKVSKDSTDAINGSQLYGVIDGLTSGSYLHYAGDDAKDKDKTDNAVIKQSISNNRLDILGGADKTKLSDNNIGVNNDGSGKLLVKLAKDLKDLMSTNVSGIVTNASGIAMADKKITGLANGEVSANSKEAVTGSQLYELTNKPLTFTGDTGTTTRKLGEATKFEGNDDITTRASEGKVAFTLNKGAVAAGDNKVVSGDVVNTALNNKFNAVTLNTSGDSGTGAVNLASQNLAINGTEGIVTKAENQKVTVSLSEATKNKLAEVDTKIGNNDISLSGDKLESGTGDNTTTKVALNKTGGINFGIKGGAEGALSDKNIGVLTGTEGVTVKLAKELKGLTSTEVSGIVTNASGIAMADKKITGLAKGDVSKDSTDAINGAQLHELKQNVETNRYKGWKINSDKTGSGVVEGNASKDVNSTNEVKFIAGNNVKLVQDGLNMTIQTLDNVAFSKVTVGDVSIEAAGINAGNKVISNVADGAISADSKEAINGSQLHTAKTELTNALNTKAEELKTDGFSLTAQDNQSVKKKLGESIEVVGADDNVSTKVEDGKIKVALNKDLKVDSVKAGENTFNGTGLNVGGVTVKKDGIHANDKKITGLANGDVSADSKDAVNGAQMHSMKQDIEAKRYKGWSLSVAKGEGDATVGTKSTIGSEDEVKFTADENIKLVKAGNDIKISTTKDVKFDTVTVGNTVIKDNSITMGDTKMTDKGFEIGGVKITKDGINAGDKVISNVADGDISETSKQAINGSQIYKVKNEITSNMSNAIDTAKTELINKGFGLEADDGNTAKEKLGNTISIIGKDKNIQTEVKDNKVLIGLSNNIDLGKHGEIKVGDTTINNDGVTAGDIKLNKEGLKAGDVNISKDGINAGDNKISNVANGDISPTSKDAVNGSQLYSLMGSATPTTTKYETIEYDENNNPKYVSQNVPEGKSVMTQSIDGHNVAVLKTYNVHSNKEIVTNNIVEAIYNMNEQGIKFFHSNDGVERSKEEQTNSFDSSASGKFATAIGSKSKAEGEHAVAIGFNSVVTGKDSISIGTGNQVTGNNSGAFGDPSTVSGQGSYSVGNNNAVSTNDTFVLGNEVKHTVENSVVLGTKSTATIWRWKPYRKFI